MKRVGIGKGEGCADIFPDGKFVQAAEQAYEVDVIKAKLVHRQKVWIIGIFRIDAGPRTHVHVGGQQQLFVGKLLMEVLGNGFIKVVYSPHLSGLPLVYLLMVIKQRADFGVAHNFAVDVNIGQTDAPVGIAVLLGVLVDERPGLFKKCLKDVQNDKVLVFEVVGDGALGNAQGVGYFLEGSAVITILNKHLLGGLQNLVLQISAGIFTKGLLHGAPPVFDLGGEIFSIA